LPQRVEVRAVPIVENERIDTRPFSLRVSSAV
jgi:hypothetical protein